MRGRKAQPPVDWSQLQLKSKSPQQLAAVLGNTQNTYKVIEDGRLIWEALPGAQADMFFWTHPPGPLFLDNGVLRPVPEWRVDECLMAGPRGFGKTAAGAIWLAHHRYNPQYAALVLRRTNESLKEFIAKAWPILKLLGYEKRSQPVEFHHRSGSVIYTGYFEKLEDYEQYRGHEYMRILLEEAQQWSQESLYVTMFGSSRSAVAGIPAQLLLTANPDGPGNGWLKARFVRCINAKTQEFIPERTLMWDPSGKRMRMWIQGTAEENTYLRTNDPHYYDRINDPSLPEHTRRAWRFGDWDAATGAFFPQFRSRRFAGEPPEALHVIPSFTLPAWCHRWISCDWAFGHHSAVYWYAIGPDKRIHVEDEMVIRAVGSDELGAEIAKRTYPKLKDSPNKRIRMYLSHETFGTRDKHHMIANQISDGIQRVLGPGSSILMTLTPDEVQAAKAGNVDQAMKMRTERLKQHSFEGTSIWVTKCNPDRKAGWSYLRNLLRFVPLGKKLEPNLEFAKGLLEKEGVLAYQEYLKMFDKQDEEIVPKLLIHDNCRVLTETIPKLFPNPDDPEDVQKFDSSETEVGDDPADSLRFGVMAYRDHENKVPFDIWLPQKVAELSASMGIVDDVQLKVQMAMHLEAKHRREQAGTGALPMRDSMALRWGGYHGF